MCGLSLTLLGHMLFPRLPSSTQPSHVQQDNTLAHKATVSGSTPALRTHCFLCTPATHHTRRAHISKAEKKMKQANEQQSAKTTESGNSREDGGRQRRRRRKRRGGRERRERKGRKEGRGGGGGGGGTRAGSEGMNIRSNEARMEKSSEKDGRRRRREKRWGAGARLFLQPLGAAPLPAGGTPLSRLSRTTLAIVSPLIRPAAVELCHDRSLVDMRAVMCAV